MFKIINYFLKNSKMNLLFILKEKNDILLNIFSVIGEILSLIVNLSPGILFYEFKTGKRELIDIPQLMFWSNLINCSINLSYSILLNNIEMLISNIICTLITIIYTSMFLWYYTNDLYKFFIFLFITYDLTFELIYGTTQTFYDLGIEINENITNIIGIIQAVFGTINTIVPGHKISQVFNNGYYKVIPIFTTISQFFCSLFWSIYGILGYNNKNNSLLVFITNFIGSLLTLFQIIVYFYYYSKNKDKLFNEDIKDDDINLMNEKKEANKEIKKIDYDQESL